MSPALSLVALRKAPVYNTPVNCIFLLGGGAFVAANATLNVRIEKSLKARGDAVLAREGASVSGAVRELYRYLDQFQELPLWMRDEEEKDVYERRREGIRSLVGIVSVPEDFDSSKLKAGRLSRYEF